MTDYREIDWLAPYFLAESYVLDICVRPGSLTLEMDLALHEDHPLHGPPAVGERHCYRRGSLEFSRVGELCWVGQGTAPARDATGERDYGSFDSFDVDGTSYIVAGDFGRIAVTAGRLSIHIGDWSDH